MNMRFGIGFIHMWLLLCLWALLGRELIVMSFEMKIWYGNILIVGILNWKIFFEIINEFYSQIQICIPLDALLIPKSCKRVHILQGCSTTLLLLFHFSTLRRIFKCGLLKLIQTIYIYFTLSYTHSMSHTNFIAK